MFKSAHKTDACEPPTPHGAGVGVYSLKICSAWECMKCLDLHRKVISTFPAIPSKNKEF